MCQSLNWSHIILARSYYKKNSAHLGSRTQTTGDQRLPGLQNPWKNASQGSRKDVSHKPPPDRGSRAMWKYLICTVSLRGRLIPRLGRSQVEALPAISYFLLLLDVSICFPAVEPAHRARQPLLKSVSGTLGTWGAVDGVQGGLRLQVGH